MKVATTTNTRRGLTMSNQVSIPVTGHIKNSGIITHTHAGASHLEETNASDTILLDIHKSQDIKRAVNALVSGETPLIIPFGNIIGAFSNPSAKAVGDLNELKGRPRNQTGSITTSPNHYKEIANWDKLDPTVLTQKQVLDIINHLSIHGPVGFILPAADAIPSHLSKVIEKNGKKFKTVQLIVPGQNSPASIIFKSAADNMPETPYLFATSANMSKMVTGQEQAAHHRFDPLIEEFAREGRRGLTIVVDDERAMRIRHPYHDSRSTSIIDLTDPMRDSKGHLLLDKKRRFVIRVSRHGSAHEDYVRKALEQHGFGVHFPDDRIPKREYSPAEQIRYAAREFRAGVAVKLLPRVTRR